MTSSPPQNPDPSPHYSHKKCWDGVPGIHHIRRPQDIAKICLKKHRITSKLNRIERLSQTMETMENLTKMVIFTLKGLNVC